MALSTYTNPIPRSTDLGIDSSYQKLLDANPYASATYDQGLFDSFLESLGFRSRRRAFQEQLAIQSDEYISSVVAQARQEKYDSAEAQAQRERMAGINPALAGNVDAGSSSSIEPDNNPMTIPPADFDSAASAVEGIAGICNTVIGIFNGIQGIRGLFIGNQSKDLDIMNSVVSRAYDDSLIEGKPNIIEGVAESVAKSRPDWYQGDDGMLDSLDASILSAERYYKAPIGVPKKYHDLYNSMRRQFKTSPFSQKSVEQNLNEWMKNKTERKKYEQSEYWSNGIDDLMSIATKYIQQINDAQLKIYNENLLDSEKLRSKQISNEVDYESSINRSLDAQTVNAQNLLAKQDAQMYEKIRSSLSSMVDELKKKVDHAGNNFQKFLANSMLLGIQVLQSQSFHPHVSASSSSTPYKSNSSFNFGL